MNAANEKLLNAIANDAERFMFEIGEYNEPNEDDYNRWLSSAFVTREKIDAGYDVRESVTQEIAGCLKSGSKEEIDELISYFTEQAEAQEGEHAVQAADLVKSLNVFAKVMEHDSFEK